MSTNFLKRCSAFGQSLLLFALLFGSMAKIATAQLTSATLRGTVTDASGASVSGATVTATDRGKGAVYTTTTNKSGYYALPDLNATDYSVRVTAPSFSTATEYVTLRVGVDKEVDVKLASGSVTTIVEVSNTGTQVELASSGISSVVDSTTMRAIPLNGRDWTQLATLVPGVVKNNTQRATGGARGNRGFGTTVSIGGSRAYQNVYRIDGINVDDYANTPPSSVTGFSPGVDALQEFSVLTTGFDARYGMTAGGVVNAITRSGTNAIHGSAYEFIRNSVLDTRNFFDPVGSKPPFRRNTFGATIGGPIWKNHTFVFANYEGFRQARSISTLATVFSDNARLGILTSGTVTIDPAVRPFLTFFHPENSGNSGDTGTYTFRAKTVDNENFFTTRLDHRFSDKDALYATYTYDSANDTLPDTLNTLLILNSSERNTGSAQETHTFNDHLVNALRGGINRSYAHALDTAPGANPDATSSAFGAWAGLNAPYIVPGGGISTFSGGVGGQALSFYYFTTYQGYDDLSWTHGKHQITTGFAFERIDSNELIDARPTGEYDFASIKNFLTNVPSNFISDIYTNGQHSLPMRGLRQSIYGAYIQDDWKVRPNLTVNLGVRYEFATVPTEAHNRIGNLRYVTDQTITIGSPYFTNPTKKDFQPRVGMNWDPFGKSQTSIRANFGIFDILPLTYQFNLMQGFTAPYFLYGTLSTSSTPAITPGSFPTGGPAIIQASTANQLLRAPSTDPTPPRNYVEQYSMSVQQQLGRTTTVTVGYAGSHGVHMTFVANDANFVLPTHTADGYLWTGSTVQNPKFGEIRALYHNEQAHYNSLLAQATTHLGRQLQMTESFTWGRSIDGMSSEIIGATYSNSVSSLYIDRALNKGPSDFQIDRSLVVNGIWTIPGPHGAEYLQKIAGGWQAVGLLTLQDGQPFTPLISGDRLGLGNDSPYDVPSRAPTCSHLTNTGSANRNSYINLSCYQLPATAGGVITTRLLGNAGRNSINGPGVSNLDFALLKNTDIKRISQDFHIQFRAECFNVFNHFNMAQPANSIYAATAANNTAYVATAGKITAANGFSREMQLGVKFIF